MRRSVVSIATLLVFAAIIYSQLTLFVVQPIGLIPEGKTIVMLRMGEMKFIEGATESVIERQVGLA